MMFLLADAHQCISIFSIQTLRGLHINNPSFLLQRSGSFIHLFGLPDKCMQIRIAGFLRARTLGRTHKQRRSQTQRDSHDSWGWLKQS